MSKYILFIFCLGLTTLGSAQVSLKLEVSADTIGMEDALRVTYKLSNARAEIQILPFEDFQIVAGPNVSSSFSMSNGDVTQEYAESYYLIPKTEGVLYLPAAAVQVEDEILETEPREIFVIAEPNYQQSAPVKSDKPIQSPSTMKEKDSDEEYQRLMKRKALAKKRKKF